MKKLDKAHMATRDELVKRLNDCFSVLDNTIEAFNAKVADEWNQVEEAQVEYNQVLSELADWRDQIVSEIDEYVSERSEKWQEGEKASAYESWKSEFENLDFSECQLSAPDEVTLDVENPADAIEGLPEEVES